MENKNPDTKTGYAVKAKFIRSWYHETVSLITEALLFISLKRKRKYWGVVYDALTKQPLDPAIVKLAYVGETEVQTCVTDLAGRYGFFAHPGKFKLLAKKTNYDFPSKHVAGDSDGIYDNIYHGEFFELNGDYEIIAPNIPMDPVQADWNQSAKMDVYRTHPYRSLLVRRLVAVFFWFGFVYCLLLLWDRWGAVPLAAWAALAVYAGLFFAALTIPDIRLWGMVSSSGLPEGSILLELHNALASGVVFGKTAALADGKFFLRANKGTYLLVAKLKNPAGEVTVLGQADVTIGKEGTLNSTIVIRKKGGS